MLEYNQIKRVHLEISTLCNASCPQCPRNACGFPFNAGYPELNMTLTMAKQIFTSDFVQQLDEILINGNFGDMVMNQETPDIVDYWKELNPNLSIVASTNGGARNKQFWERLAKQNLSIDFCIDGLEDTHHLYRQNTRFDTVVRNAKIFIAAGGTAYWKCIDFLHNKHQQEQMKMLAGEWGFKGFDVIDHGRNYGPVYNSQGKMTHTLGGYPMGDHGVLQVALADKVSSWDKFLREHRQNSSFDPRQDEVKISCDTIEQNRIYISADGQVFPCCYTGFYPGKYKKGAPYIAGINHQLLDFISENNALQYSIEHSVKWFNKLQEKWTERDYAKGRPIVCDAECGSCGVQKISSRTWLNDQ